MNSQNRRKKLWLRGLEPALDTAEVWRQKKNTDLIKGFKVQLFEDCIAVLYLHPACRPELHHQLIPVCRAEPMGIWSLDTTNYFQFIKSNIFTTKWGILFLDFLIFLIQITEQQKCYGNISK